jgi:hypothetical protein
MNSSLISMTIRGIRRAVVLVMFCLIFVGMLLTPKLLKGMGLNLTHLLQSMIGDLYPRPITLNMNFDRITALF